VSLTLLLAVTAAVAGSMGYFAARRHGDGDPLPTSEEEDKQDGEPGIKAEKKKDEQRPPPAPVKPSKPKKPAGSPFAALPLALGDVVSSGAEERWLAGAIVAREGGQVIAALFLAPEGTKQHAVAVFAPPRRDVWWMAPTDVVSPAEPHATVELAGVALQRKARLPVTLERLGQGAPDVGEDGVWAVYGHGRDVAVVIASLGKAHAWVGARLEEGEYDRLGGGGDE
jgi:hypothetical protein